MLKSSPEAPGEGYILAEIAEEVGLPPGVLNVVTADREVSELLVRDPRVDKITFTGSTAAGRRIASICGERIARCTLELGGKSAAVILDDIDLETVAQTIDLRPERGVHRRRGASAVAGELRSGTVGHNAFRTDFGIAFGGFKQSGIGREGGTEGLHPFLETKTVILEGRPGRYDARASSS